jgi:hypothetical protein
MLLQDKIQRADRTPGIVNPRIEPEQQPDTAHVQLRRSRSSRPPV